MKLIATITLVVVAAAAGVWGTSALEEQAHDRELSPPIAWAFLDQTKVP
jgi:hypothetical protein